MATKNFTWVEVTGRFQIVHKVVIWSPRGVKILGTPIGSQEFVRSLGVEWLQEEQRLWEAISWVPDVQCAWQILLQCAGLRCHHHVRTLSTQRVPVLRGRPRQRHGNHARFVGRPHRE